jgi:lipoprotein-releasing system ATP-binding protein
MSDGQAPLLAADGIHKSYWLGRREIPVLRGVDFAIGRGEVVGLLGASGAGKSTLMHVLGLLDPPTKGSVLLDGRPVHALPIRERASLRNRQIGFVFQFYHLIPELSALQNVQLGRMMFVGPLGYWAQRRAIRERAQELLTLVGLQDRLAHRPATLSGGERQRVAIARALIAEPRVILADEPTGNLDSETAEGVLDLLMSINRDLGIAFVFVTHDQDLASRCHRVVHLRDGLVVG